MSGIDHSKIVLTKDELQFFKKFPLDGSGLDCGWDAAWPLMQEKLVEQEYQEDENGHGIVDDSGYTVYTGLYRLSKEGKRHRQYLRDTQAKHRNSEIRAWITLGVAILGFIGAVVALIWQGVTEGYINLV